MNTHIALLHAMPSESAFGAASHCIVWLFFDTGGAANVSANLHTLMETCKVN